MILSYCLCIIMHWSGSADAVAAISLYCWQLKIGVLWRQVHCKSPGAYAVHIILLALFSPFSQTSCKLLMLFLLLQVNFGDTASKTASL